jgi:hypothetical protein
MRGVTRGLSTITLAAAMTIGLALEAEAGSSTGRSTRSPEASGAAAPGVLPLGEPSGERHVLVKVGCTGGTDPEFFVAARTKVRTLDMKDNNTARVPAFYKLVMKVETQTLRVGGLWRNKDTHTEETVEIQRKGQFIVASTALPPYPRGTPRGSWTVKFGDSTRMINPGDRVRAKITVTLERQKSALNQWKYTRYSKTVTCADDDGSSGMTALSM